MSHSRTNTRSKETTDFLPCHEVLANTGTGTFIVRVQGILSNYFQGTRELLIRLLGSREHLSTFYYIFFCYEQKVKQANKCGEQ